MRSTLETNWNDLFTASIPHALPWSARPAALILKQQQYRPRKKFCWNHRNHSKKYLRLRSLGNLSTGSIWAVERSSPPGRLSSNNTIAPREPFKNIDQTKFAMIWYHRRHMAEQLTPSSRLFGERSLSSRRSRRFWTEGRRVCCVKQGKGVNYAACLMMLPLNNNHAPMVWLERVWWEFKNQEWKWKEPRATLGSYIQFPSNLLLVIIIIFLSISQCLTGPMLCIIHGCSLR